MAKTAIPPDFIQAVNASGSVTPADAGSEHYRTSEADHFLPDAAHTPALEDTSGRAFGDPSLENLDETSVLIPRAPIAPNAPVVAGRFMKASQLTFLEFLFEPDCVNYCRFMFGEEVSSAETMLAEFRRGVDSVYFGTVKARPGRHAWMPTEAIARSAASAIGCRWRRGSGMPTRT
jgi:hypothetical protein